MRTRFYIEKRKDQTGNLLLKDRPVLMSVSFSGNRVMLSTGIKTDFSGWDSEQQRIKSSIPGSIATNTWLDTLYLTAHRTWAEIRSGFERPDRDRFRELFQELKPKYSTGFFDVFLLFIESGMNRWSTATYRKVRTIYKHLREFDDTNEFGISFATMNRNFLDSFSAYYASRGNSQATTHKAINIVVWFLNWATDQGYNVKMDFRKFYKYLGKPVGSATRQLYLKKDELLKLKEWVCADRKTEKVRDLFCFMCYTGLRYSEIQVLRKEDIHGSELDLHRKGGRQKSVLMNQEASEIHSRYENKYFLNNTAFPSMSIITFNKYLRIIGEEASLNRMVRSLKDPEEKIPLYACLTAGMGRQTFLSTIITSG